jgi:tetratricopeptide (TPR) repeat protein
MKPLEPPDSFHLSAAIGWLELGNPLEAKIELERIAPELQSRADVLEVRWQAAAAAHQWEACQIVAVALMQHAPDRLTAWIYRAYARRRVDGGGLQAAWDALRPAIEKFPEESIIPYNLACYACQLGNLEDAWAWLERSLAIGDRVQIKALALADPDLKALWPRLDVP